jgi:hypothetical protein
MFEPGMFEYGLKTGALSEQEIIKIIKKANNKIAKEINDSRIPKGLNMKKYTGPFGRSTPDAEPPEYDHIYWFRHRVSNLFLELYPNQEKNGRVKFPDEEIIWNLYVWLMDGDYPPKLSEDDHIQEFGCRVMEELFRTLPCEKVLIKKYAPGEDRL